MDKIYIADVSHHNTVKFFNPDTIHGIMIRCSYGMNGLDKKVEQHVSLAEKSGLPYGFYHFSYATNMEEAEKNFENFSKTISSFHPTLPCAIDFEADDYLTNKGLPFNASNSKIYTEIARHECELLEKCGYYTMIYANSYDMKHVFTDELRDRFGLWVADWSGKTPTFDTMRLHQYTSKGKVDGIEGNVDLSVGDESFLSLQAKVKNVSRETIKTGDIVRPTTRIDYNGEKNADWVLHFEFVVKSVNKDRVVIGTDSGITGAWKMSDLEKL